MLLYFSMHMRSNVSAHIACMLYWYRPSSNECYDYIQHAKIYITTHAYRKVNIENIYKYKTPSLSLDCILCQNNGIMLLNAMQGIG